jgi:hypothetical protein
MENLFLVLVLFNWRQNNSGFTIFFSYLLNETFSLDMQENLIHDDQKLILLASLSDSLEYLADSVER